MAKRNKSLDERLKDAVEGKIPESNMAHVQQGEEYDKFFSSSTKTSKTESKKDTIKLSGTDKQDDAARYQAKLDKCMDALKKYKIKDPQAEVHTTLMKAIYFKIDTNDSKPYIDIMTELTKKYKLKSDAVEVITDAYMDFMTTSLSILSNKSPTEAIEFLTSLLPKDLVDDMGDVTSKISKLIKGANRPKRNKERTSVDISYKRDDKKSAEKAIKEAIKNDANLSGLSLDGLKGVIIRPNERIGLYDVPLGEVERDVWCDLVDNPKELAKYDKPTYPKIDTEDKDKMGLIGMNAQVCPIFNLPQKTLVLMRDSSDNIKLDTLEFKEVSPFRNPEDGGTCHLFRSKLFREMTPFKDNERLHRAHAYYFPWKLDALSSTPMLMSESGFNSIGPAVVNHDLMPVDDVNFVNDDREQIFDAFISITGTHLQEQVLRILGKTAVRDEDVATTVIERLCAFDTFAPTTVLNDGKDCIRNIIDSMVRYNLQHNNKDISVLVALGVVNPYDCLSLEFVPELPTQSQFGYTPCDPEGSEKDTKDFIDRLLRLSLYNAPDRLLMIDVMAKEVKDGYEAIRNNRKGNGYQVELIKYFYNLVHTFRIYYHLDEKSIERVRIARDALSKAMESGYSEFILKNEALENILKYMDIVIKEGPSDHGTDITLTTRAIGIGCGVLEHTFVGKKTNIPILSKIADIVKGKSKDKK